SEPSSPFPVELGAEFIHGSAPRTFEWLRQAGLHAVDTAGNRVTVGDGGSRATAAPFDDLARLMARVDALAEPDLSVEDFLAREARDPALAAACARARMMVEGFDAADPSRASVRAIAREWAHLDGGQFRPAGGYGALLVQAARSLDGAGAYLRLQTRVESVDWTGGEVKITASSPAGPLRMAARRALVTFPVSVLQLPPHAPGAVRFNPPLEEKAVALAGVALGPVIKVVLRFRRAFWEGTGDGRFEHAGFLHSPQGVFPTVWTSLPARVPFLTAWMGGPRAARLQGAGTPELIRSALDSVRTLFGTGRELDSELSAAYVHDWQQDPHARGAYSYLTVGGIGAPDGLARPLAGRLFFAGEATSSADPGTVEAALQSGRRAAGEILASLRED
ncbi:MAG: flavin monoamine oxidase family protein, partial [Steroidobacteraceae bacterium]